MYFMLNNILILLVFHNWNYAAAAKNPLRTKQYDKRSNN